MAFARWIREAQRGSENLRPGCITIQKLYKESDTDALARYIAVGGRRPRPDDLVVFIQEFLSPEEKAKLRQQFLAAKAAGLSIPVDKYAS